MKYIEERINKERHFVEVGNFSCGADDPLDLFLSDMSFEYDEESYGSTYLLKDEKSGLILAFYTIKTNGIQTYDPDKNEYNSIPVIEIARIAVGYDYQGIGLGSEMFYEYILPKVTQVKNLVAVKAIIVFVEPENLQGIHFYKSLGFERASQEIQNSISDSFNENCDLYLLLL